MQKVLTHNNDVKSAENTNAPRHIREVMDDMLQSNSPLAEGYRNHLNLGDLDTAMADAETKIAEGNGGIDAELENKLKACEIDMDAEYPKNEFLFKVDDTEVITQSDIHVVGGAQKAGKSTLIAILMAAVLCGEWHRVKCLLNDMRVLYIDTEMKKVDTQSLAAKAAKMADVDIKKVKKLISLVNFRPLTPAEMEVGIRYYIRKYKPQLVIIDGIVDLCSNFNDVEASQNLVLNFLMKIAEQEKCAVISVLHTNKTDGYTELRGHLGAFFEQKGTTVIKCEKDKDTNIVTAKTTTHRYAPVPDFHFTYDDEGLPVCADEFHQLLEQQKAQAKQEKKEADKKAVYEERKQIVVDILNANDGKMERKFLIAEAMKRLDRKETIVKTLLKMMLQEAMPSIEEDGNMVTALVF